MSAIAHWTRDALFKSLSGGVRRTLMKYFEDMETKMEFSINSATATDILLNVDEANQILHSLSMPFRISFGRIGRLKIKLFLSHGTSYCKLQDVTICLTPDFEGSYKEVMTTKINDLRKEISKISKISDPTPDTPGINWDIFLGWIQRYNPSTNLHLSNVSIRMEMPSEDTAVTLFADHLSLRPDSDLWDMSYSNISSQDSSVFATIDSTQTGPDPETFDLPGVQKMVFSLSTKNGALYSEQLDTDNTGRVEVVSKTDIDLQLSLDTSSDHRGVTLFLRSKNRLDILLRPMFWTKISSVYDRMRKIVSGARVNVAIVDRSGGPRARWKNALKKIRENRKREGDDFLWEFEQRVNDRRMAMQSVHGMCASKLDDSILTWDTDRLLLNKDKDIQNFLEVLSHRRGEVCARWFSIARQEFEYIQNELQDDMTPIKARLFFHYANLNSWPTIAARARYRWGVWSSFYSKYIHAHPDERLENVDAEMLSPSTSLLRRSSSLFLRFSEATSSVSIAADMRHTNLFICDTHRPRVALILRRFHFKTDTNPHYNALINLRSFSLLSTESVMDVHDPEALKAAPVLIENGSSRSVNASSGPQQSLSRSMSGMGMTDHSSLSCTIGRRQANHMFRQPLSISCSGSLRDVRIGMYPGIDSIWNALVNAWTVFDSIRLPKQWKTTERLKTAKLRIEVRMPSIVASVYPTSRSGPGEETVELSHASSMLRILTATKNNDDSVERVIVSTFGPWKLHTKTGVPHLLQLFKKIWRTIRANIFI